MKLINYLLNKAQAFTVLFAALVLTSCGSYQYVGQSSDGIYGTPTENQERETVAISAENNNDYYTNYFKEKAIEAEVYTQTDDVFTDVDSYQGTYDESTEVTEQNAGWGATSSNVIINIHDTGYYNNYGWNRPWGWNGWYNWGWNSPYSWNYGFGWNNSFYNPYWGWGSPYYGYYHYGYGYGYGHGYAYNHGYYRRGISYNAGRRGSLINRNYLNTRYSRNNTVRPRTNSTVRPRTNNTVRPRTNNTVRPRTNNTVRPRTNNTVRPRTNNTVKPRTNTTRPRTNTSTPRPRSNNTSAPRSTSSPRSSSTSNGGSRRGRG